MRLTLLCAAATASSRTGAFPLRSETLDADGARKARSYGWRGPVPDLVLSSPSLAAIGTTRAIGFEPRVEPLVADLDCGEWSGRSLAEIHGVAPGALEHWLAEPATKMPGGEPMDDVARRIGSVLDRLVIGDARSVLIVTHAAPMRAAIAHALGAPVGAAMRIDVTPLGSVLLSWHRQWRLQALHPPKPD